MLLIPHMVSAVGVHDRGVVGLVEFPRLPKLNACFPAEVFGRVRWE